MAKNKYHFSFPSGNNVYIKIYKPDRTVWYPPDEVFEVEGTGGRSQDDYDVPLTDLTGDEYESDIDIALPLGIFDVEAYLQSGGSPDSTDSMVGHGFLVWDGCNQEDLNAPPKMTLGRLGR